MFVGALLDIDPPSCAVGMNFSIETLWKHNVWFEEGD